VKAVNSSLKAANLKFASLRFASLAIANLYLTILILGYISAGWLLAAFQVSSFVWIGTLGILLYLAKVGTDAIAVASAWIVGVISVGAVIKAWAPVWNSRMPYENARLWAGGLLLLWVWATVLVVLLAFAHARMQAIGLRFLRSSNGLALLIGIALGCGGLIYKAVYRFT
jgi:hypothetical protein